MRILKATMIAIALSVFTGAAPADKGLVTRDVAVFKAAASANEATITLDIEASLERQVSAGTSRTDVSTTIKTPFGKQVKIVGDMQDRRLSIAVTPSRLDNGDVRLAFVLSEIMDTGERVLAEPAMHTSVNQTASFVHGALLEGHSFRLAVTPRL